MVTTISVGDARASACDVCCGDDAWGAPVGLFWEYDGASTGDPAIVEPTSALRLTDAVSYSWDYEPVIAQN